MNKSAIKKFSVLGLVLIGASAVTAAILPSKAEKRADFNGTLRNTVETDDGDNDVLNTCIPNVSGAASCHYTAASDEFTTGGDPAANSANATQSNTTVQDIPE